MTPDNPAFVDLSKRVDMVIESQNRMMEALLGDQLTGKVGIIGHHNRMLEDVYGLDAHGEPLESKKNTLLIRVSELEDGRKKAKWLLGGALFAALAAKMGITALIEKYWK